MTRAEAMLYDLRQLSRQDFNSQRMHVSIEIDPITEIETIAFFTDDGRGNGLCIFEMTTEDFQKGCLNWQQTIGA